MCENVFFHKIFFSQLQKFLVLKTNKWITKGIQCKQLLVNDKCLFMLHFSHSYTGGGRAAVHQHKSQEAGCSVPCSTHGMAEREPNLQTWTALPLLHGLPPVTSFLLIHLCSICTKFSSFCTKMFSKLVYFGFICVKSWFNIFLLTAKNKQTHMWLKSQYLGEQKLNMSLKESPLQSV